MVEAKYQKKKKIAFVANQGKNLFQTKLVWMTALLDNNYEISAIVPRDDFFNRFGEHGIKAIEYSVNRGLPKPLQEIKSLFQLYAIFKSENFDIIHTFAIKANILGSLAGKFAGLRTIVNTVEGLGYAFVKAGFRKEITKILALTLYTISFLLCKKVIFMNREDINDSCLFISKKKIFILPGAGVNTDFFSPDNFNNGMLVELRNGLGLKEENVVITFTARLLFDKGLKELIYAVKYLVTNYPEITLLIVGEGDKDNPSSVTEQFIKETQCSFIKFYGYRKGIREILAITDIYALPSFYREGIPKSILEAMSMARPIITTDVPGCRETVNNGINGFIVPPKNGVALAQAIEWFLKDEKLREDMGKAGRKKSIREFSDQVVISKILGLYESLS